MGPAYSPQAFRRLFAADGILGEGTGEVRSNENDTDFQQRDCQVRRQQTSAVDGSRREPLALDQD